VNSNESVFWADDFGRFDKAMSVHHLPCFGAAAITPADRVLDVGCGTGRTTLHAARAATAGSVLGVDLSAGMIGYARREGLGNVTFAQADAQVYLFTAGAFDVAVSQHPGRSPSATPSSSEPCSRWPGSPASRSAPTTAECGSAATTPTASFAP
jgi:SAM-dependent methyltransferase